MAARGLEFGYLEDGPADGPLALCLHGFPDSAWTWRHLLPRLADAGFHAVAPFSRGYAPTSVPADPLTPTGALAADLVALHGALGGDGSAVLVGHDWGAYAVYGAAGAAPDRWRRVAALAVPPGLTTRQRTAYDQARRSFYVWLFLQPEAEAAVAADDLAFLDRLWADWSPGYDAAPDLQRVKACLREPERLAAAIGYYRARVAPPDPSLAAEQAASRNAPPQPTLYLHGAQDGCLGAELAEGVQLSPGSEAAVLPDVGHFLHLEQPEEVGSRIVEFLTR